MNKIIGGYFGLELSKKNEYHYEAIRLNTGRSCLEYILRLRRYRKIYLPHYICNAILEPIVKLKIKFEFYFLSKELDPIFEKDLKCSEALLYVNYFGIKKVSVEKLVRRHKNMIIDNCQAFFDEPLEGIDTIYSARKFFGVSDGAYLYTNKLLKRELKSDVSWYRMMHLLKRNDIGAEFGYSDFQKNEASLSNQPIKQMSNLTQVILNAVDYQKIRKRRIINFQFLHNILKKYNEFKINEKANFVPMVYPFLVNKGGLHRHLIKNGIYVAKYWSKLATIVDKNSIEGRLVDYLIPLPIDQRYNGQDMKQVAKLVKKFLI